MSFQLFALCLGAGCVLFLENGAWVFVLFAEVIVTIIHGVRLSNRLTALCRTARVCDEDRYAIIVAGYAGGDIVAQQLISALCMNKAFRLPPRFCMLETANDAGAAVKLPGIDQRLTAFADNMFP